MPENNRELQQDSLYTSLKELGLAESEINLYTASLKLGPSPITKIAEAIGISRPNVYKVIDGLEKHGLVKIERAKYARDFVVEPPTEVLELLRKKRESMAQLDNQLSSSLPDLLATYRQGGRATKIKILQGKDQYVKAFKQIVEESNGTIEYFGSAQDFIKFVSWDMERDFIKGRLKKNIFIKSLLLPSPDGESLRENDRKELRETRFFEGQAPFVTSFQLFANKVIIWQPEAPLALLIEDEYIVQMFRSMFYGLWEISV